MRLTIEWSRDRIPLRPLGNFGNFLYPTLPVSFGRDTKSRWSLLSGAYARGSKISHTGGKCVTCCGLRPCSTWSIMSKTTLIKYSVKVYSGRRSTQTELRKRIYADTRVMSFILLRRSRRVCTGIIVGLFILGICAIPTA